MKEYFHMYMRLHKSQCITKVKVENSLSGA